MKRRRILKNLSPRLQQGSVIAARWTAITMVVAALIGLIGVIYASNKPFTVAAKTAEVMATTKSWIATETQLAITNTFTPSPTHTEEIITATPTSTLIPITITSSATQAIIPDLANGCINNAIWTPYRGEASPIDNLGCWDLSLMGITPENGGLSIQFVSPSEAVLNGIYRSINSYSRIDFDVRISVMDTLYDMPPELTFGILPSTLRSVDTGKYLAYQRGSNMQDDLFIRLVDGTINRGHYLPLRYNFNDTHHVTLWLDGLKVSIYINSNLIEEAISLSFEAEYFWIGYDLPLGTSVIAEVTNIIVTDQ